MEPQPIPEPKPTPEPPHLFPTWFFVGAVAGAAVTWVWYCLTQHFLTWPNLAVWTGVGLIFGGAVVGFVMDACRVFGDRDARMQLLITILITAALTGLLLLPHVQQARE